MVSNGTGAPLSRFECKYLISESQAEQIRHRIAFEMDLDKYSTREPSRRYVVNSLYLDSPQYVCYHATRRGEKDRFKLRVRWYGKSATPAFLEEKRRTNDSIAKSRVPVSTAGLERLLEGRELRRSDVEFGSQNGAEARRLQDKILAMQALPACVVRYDREAWHACGADYPRVTFDTREQVRRADRRALEEHDKGWLDVSVPKTILEIKFIEAIPGWLLDVISLHGLQRVSVPKYILGRKCLIQDDSVVLNR